MSAKLETFFELKKVVDHNCGNYRIGEIDFVNYDAIQIYILEHGELGFNELMRVISQMMHAANQQIGIKRAHEFNKAQMDSMKPQPNKGE